MDGWTSSHSVSFHYPSANTSVETANWKLAFDSDSTHLNGESMAMVVDTEYEEDLAVRESQEATVACRVGDLDYSVKHVLVAYEMDRCVVDDMGNLMRGDVVKFSKIVLDLFVKSSQSVGLVNKESS